MTILRPALEVWAMELFLARVTAEYGSLRDWVATLDVPAETIDTLRARLLA